MLNKVINEALGEFPQQYSLAKEISETVINMVKTHDRKGIFKASTNGMFKTYIINIEYSENDELNHGYVIVAQAKYNMRLNRDLVNDLPTWYEPIIRLINQYQMDDDIVMRFAKALYACYEKEMKAIVSETTPHIEKELGCKPYSTRNDFINALKNCEPFKRYYQALYEVLPEARLKKDRIKQVFNTYGIEYGEWMFDFIAQKSTMALKYVEKNAMIYFHEHIKLGKTDWFEKHNVK